MLFGVIVLPHDGPFLHVEPRPLEGFDGRFRVVGVLPAIAVSEATPRIMTYQRCGPRIEARFPGATACRLRMDLLAGIRVLWDFVGEVQPAGVAVGIGFDGEQQVSEFGGVFLFLGEDGFYHRA